jgi:peptide deformylase
MILPIVGYGSPVLRKIATDIDKNYPELTKLLDNMFETMENAYGVGLAAPQIGLAIRLFIVDTTPFSENEDLTVEERTQLNGFKKVFINAKITKEEGEQWVFNEGCLSIPNVREDVSRSKTVHITYQDEQFNTHNEVFDGLIARVIQHEYDHIEGVLFTDKISTFKKAFIKKKLQNIMEGKVNADYKMKFASIKK